MRVVADGVTLERVRFVLGDGAVHFIQPTRLAWRENRVAQHALGPEAVVDARAGRRSHGIGQEPIRRNIRGRAADQRDLRVAVEVDFLDVVVELEVLDSLRLVDQVQIPSSLAHRFAHAQESLDLRVVAQELSAADALPAGELTGHPMRVGSAAILPQFTAADGIDV